MTENKNGWRIAAGICFLLNALALLGTYVAGQISIRMSGDMTGLTRGFAVFNFVLNIVPIVVPLLVGIFVLTRKWVGAAVTQIVRAAFALVSMVGVVRFVFQYASLSVGVKLLMILNGLLVVAVAILLAVAFFVRRRPGAIMAYLAAGLALLSALLSPVVSLLQTGMPYLQLKPMIFMQIFISLVTGVWAVLAMIFLGVYFGGMGPKQSDYIGRMMAERRPGYPAV